MAINLNNMKELMKAILADVEINMTSNAIIVTSDRLSCHRSIPFDIYRSSECEADYNKVVCKEGVYIWSNRIKGIRFVAFDYIYDLPGYTFIKIKTKGRLIPITHGIAPPPPASQVTCQVTPQTHPTMTFTDQVVEPQQSLKRQHQEDKYEHAKHQKIDQSINGSAEIYDIISTATTIASSAMDQHQKEQNEKIDVKKNENFQNLSSVSDKQQKQADLEKVQEFIGGITSATTFLDMENAEKKAK